MTNEEYNREVYGKKPLGDIPFDKLHVGMKIKFLGVRYNENSYSIKPRACDETTDEVAFHECSIVAKSNEALVIQVENGFGIFGKNEYRNYALFLLTE